jgi:hypothetical protein
VSCQVVFFTVVHGSSPMSVSCKVMELGSSLVRIIGHESLSD